MAFSASTWATMVRVDFASTSASRPSSLPSSRCARRSLESWIGVSGFLISCARRCATSSQAVSRCARASSVWSSKTITLVVGWPEIPGSVAARSISSCGRSADAVGSATSPRHSRAPAPSWRDSMSTKAASRGASARIDGRACPRIRARSTPRTPPAASLAVCTMPSVSTVMTPEDNRPSTASRYARWRSVSAWLERAAALACARSSAIWLKDAVRNPSSSSPPGGKRAAKSPAAIRCVPSDRREIGAT